MAVIDSTPSDMLGSDTADVIQAIDSKKTEEKPNFLQKIQRTIFSKMSRIRETSVYEEQLAQEENKALREHAVDKFVQEFYKLVEMRDDEINSQTPQQLDLLEKRMLMVLSGLHDNPNALEQGQFEALRDRLLFVREKNKKKNEQVEEYKQKMTSKRERLLEEARQQASNSQADVQQAIESGQKTAKIPTIEDDDVLKAQHDAGPRDHKPI
jgi:hypothetical protein